MARNHKGQWAKGESPNPGGITSKEVKASRRLKLRLADSVDDALTVLLAHLRGEDIDPQRVKTAQYVLDQVGGKPGQTRSVHVDGGIEHRHSVDLQYLEAMRQLAKAGREAKNQKMIDDQKKIAATVIPMIDLGNRNLFPRKLRQEPS